MKATAFAPVNVAAIKYWGKADADLRLPANSSLSVNLTNLTFRQSKRNCQV
ncbi:MAG: Diphosphomevalonate decarboxylase [Candidatus Beckwithbacteria bacterium GW2011_GWA1_46_30]|nr:MAG: Diphosphomevalonate decarboxylase [Candidatus Beckwithbacteria bacterium GW2011_GWA1_46_30]